MEAKKTILIADRNPRVRNLLKRELTSEGYLTFSVKNADEITPAVLHGKVDAIIMDPDLPGSVDALSIFDQLQERIGLLPLILLSCNTEKGFSMQSRGEVSIVEKGEGSLEIIKRNLKRCLY